MCYIVQCRTPLKLHQPRIPGKQITIAEAIAGILRRPQQFVKHQVLSWDGTEATQHQFEVIRAIASLPVAYINSSLKSNADVSQATRLKANLNQCFQGVIPVGKGFIIDEQKVNQWIKADSKNRDVLKLFSMGANLAGNPNSLPERWIIDFSDMPLEDASDYKLPFEHIKLNVKPEREQNREAVMREKWWRFKRTNEAIGKAIAPLSCYFAVPEVSKWAIFVPCPLDWLPGNKTKAVVSDDFYVFGVLTSNVHQTWMHAQKSTLEHRAAYTNNTCFETFPFPQMPSPLAPLPEGEGDKTGRLPSTPGKKILIFDPPYQLSSGDKMGRLPSPLGRRAGDEGLIQQIRAIAQELHTRRSTQMERKQWGITKLYNEYFHEPTSQLFKLHAKLNQLVLQAYGFKPADDLLKKLLTLNLELAEKENRGEAIVGLWAPTQ